MLIRQATTPSAPLAANARRESFCTTDTVLTLPVRMVPREVAEDGDDVGEVTELLDAVEVDDLASTRRLSPPLRWSGKT